MNKTPKLGTKEILNLFTGGRMECENGLLYMSVSFSEKHNEFIMLFERKGGERVKAHALPLEKINDVKESTNEMIRHFNMDAKLITNDHKTLWENRFVTREI